MAGADVQGMLNALCGANADYVGDALDLMPERRRGNVDRICRVALRRLGDAIAEPGLVHPRVIDCLLTDGSQVVDAVAAEYWGGLLACARSANERDDRAARRMKTLSRLGEYDIRSHYLFYTTIPAGYYILAMDYNRDEIARCPRIVSDMLVSLGMEYLVDGSNTGSDEYLKQHFTSRAIRGEGIVFSPGIQGVQLLLWAFGYRDRPHGFFVDDAFNCRIEGVAMGVDEAGLIYEK